MLEGFCLNIILLFSILWNFWNGFHHQIKTFSFFEELFKRYCNAWHPKISAKIWSQSVLIGRLKKVLINILIPLLGIHLYNWLTRHLWRKLKLMASIVKTSRYLWLIGMLTFLSFLRNDCFHQNYSYYL